MKKFKCRHFFFKYFLLLIVCPLFIAACSVTPPKNASDICAIFKEKPDWFSAAEDMQQEWGVPIHVPMAMMYQESSFKAHAAPPREYVFFGLIPWGRISSAYGYSQAKTPTWTDYIRETRRYSADRSDFDDAIDFMGWFIAKTYKVNGISKWDAHHQYLNYHEGWGGYRRKTYNKKSWLVKVAKKVNARSLTYARQLKSCREELGESWWQRIF